MRKAKLLPSALEKAIVSHTVIQIGGRVLVVLLGLVITAILTRFLGISGFGDYIFLSTWWTFLLSWSDWGTQIIGVREISKTKEEARPLVFGAVKKLRFYLLAISLFFASLAFFLLPIFADLRQYFWWLLLIVIVANQQGNFTILFQAFLHFDWQTIVELTNSGLTVALILLTFHFKMGLTGVLAAVFTSRIIASFWARKKEKSLLAAADRLTIPTKKLSYLWREALPMGSMLLLSSAYDRMVDTALLRHFWDPATVGIYGLAYKIYGNLILPAYYLSTSLFPHFSAEINRYDRFVRLFKIGLKWALAAAILAVLATWLTADWGIFILGGSSFKPAATILRILVLSLPFTYLNHIFGFSLVAKKRQWLSLIVSVISLGWNLFFNWLVIPRWAGLGAAWVTVATEMMVTGLTGFAFFRLCLAKKRP